MYREGELTFTPNYRNTYFEHEGRPFWIGVFCFGASLLIQMLLPADPSTWVGIILRFVQILLLLVGVIVFVFVSLSPTRIPCPKCGGSIASNVEWVCGTCKATNSIRWYSFLRVCGTCKSAPNMLYCPYCSEMIFLGDRAFKTPYAFAKGKRDPVMEAAARESAAVVAVQDMKRTYPQEVRETRAAESEHRKYEITRIRDIKELLNEQREALEADMAVNRTVKKLKAEVEGEKEDKLDPIEREVAAFEKEIEAHGISRLEAARIVQAKCEKRFANDSDMLKRIQEIIQKRLERESL